MDTLTYAYQAYETHSGRGNTKVEVDGGWFRPWRMSTGCAYTYVVEPHRHGSSGLRVEGSASEPVTRYTDATHTQALLDMWVGDDPLEPKALAAFKSGAQALL
jgi:hypothetical protein